MSETGLLENDFKKVINNIKNDIRTTQFNAIQQVNSELILLYYRIGKVIYDNSIWEINF